MKKRLVPLTHTADTALHFNPICHPGHTLGESCLFLTITQGTHYRNTLGYSHIYFCSLSQASKSADQRHLVLFISRSARGPRHTGRHLSAKLLYRHYPEKSEILILCHFHHAISARKSSVTPHCLQYTVQTAEVTFKAFHRLTPPLISCFFASLFCYIGPSLQSCWPIHHPRNMHVSPPAEHVPSLALLFIVHLCKCYFPWLSSNTTSSLKLKSLCYPTTRISCFFSSMGTELHSCFPLLGIPHTVWCLFLINIC